MISDPTELYALVPNRVVLPSGMSDWSMFELDDINWDVFGDDYGHIVPFSGIGQVNNFESDGDTFKKAKLDILDLKDVNIDNRESTEDALHVIEETTTFQSSLTDEKCQSVNCPFHASKSACPLFHASKCKEENTTFASDDTKVLNGHNVATQGDGVPSDEPTPRNRSVADEGNLCHFSLEASPSETDIDLHQNASNVRENGDFMDSNWPDVGCFDDADKILSYSTFWQGSSGNADELSWLSSSSYTVDGSEDTFKAGLHSPFSDLNELRDLSQPDTNICPDNDLQTVDGGKTSSIDLESFPHWLEADVQDKVDFFSKREVIVEREEKDQFQKRNIQISEHASGSPYPVSTTLAQNDNEIYMNSSIAAPLTSFPRFTGSQTQYVEIDSLECPHAPYAESYTPQTIPSVASDSSIESPKEAKHSLLIHIPAEATNNGYHPHLKHVHSSGSTNQNSTMKNLHEVKPRVGRNCQLENGSQEDTKYGNDPFSQCYSCTSSSGDILSSPKIFQQLQGAVNQLDIGTKLCIRDGLYRLAKNAEERHGIESSKPGTGADMDLSKYIGIDKSKRCHGYMDVEVETGTNPIDRSIVHLLFQRTSEHSLSC